MKRKVNNPQLYFAVQFLCFSGNHYNTGLTSTLNWGQRILTMEADLVTSHELGHNFGAEHDDANRIGTACAPGQVL